MRPKNENEAHSFQFSKKSAICHFYAFQNDFLKRPLGVAHPRVQKNVLKGAKMPNGAHIFLKITFLIIKIEQIQDFGANFGARRDSKGIEPMF